VSSHGRGAGADDSALTGRRYPRVDGALLLLAGVHVASRIAFWIDGVRFDASTLPWFWQFLDPAWLRTDLLRSLWYLHAQPPLFNAFLGIVLKLGGDAWVFPSIYLAAGLALVGALYAVLRRLGIDRWPAFAVALAYDLSPTAVLYENLLFYTEFEALALIAAALFLHRLCEGRRTRDAALFFASIAALALTRSLFHLIWFASCTALAVAATRPLQRGFLVCCAVASIAVVGLYAKNAWVFGAPSASSWFGMSLAGLTQRCWPAQELEPLIARGTVSPLIAIAPFSPLERYPEAMRPRSLPDVPSLSADRKASGEPNYNHLAYLAISRQYGLDARTLIRLDPVRYGSCVYDAMRKFLLPPSLSPRVDANREVMAGMDLVFDGIAYGVPNAWIVGGGGLRGTTRDWRSPKVADGDIGWLWLAAGSLACAYAAFVVRRTWRSAEARLRAQAAVLAFCLFNIGFVAIVANAVELGENNRFRVATEPLVTALIAFAATRIVRGRRLRSDTRV